MTLLSTGSARAQRGASDERATNAAGPISVAVYSDGDALSPAAVRDAMARSLGAPAFDPMTAQARGARRAVTVTWRPSRGELVVSYEDRPRRVVSRVVSAPKEAAEAIRIAAILANHLAQDEAAELLAPSPAPAPAPAPSAPVQPPPAPAPPEPSRPKATPPPRDESIAEISFVYPLASNMGHPDRSTHFAFNLFYGRVGEIHGAELGLVHLVGSDMNGGQIGLVSVVGRNMNGFQLGGVNVSGDVSGVQLGVVNVGRHVRGLQLGVVNVSDELDGVPIGLVSVTKGGGVHPVVWASTRTYGNIGVKFASRYVFTTISASYHDDGGRKVSGPGFTLGVRIPLDRAWFDIDVGTTWLIDGAPREGALLNRLRGSLGFRIFDHLNPFVGAGAVWSVRFTDAIVHQGKSALDPELFGGIEF